MLRKYYIFSIIITFFPSAFVFAWSAAGHGIVGDIAYNYLSPLTKSRVTYFLKGRTVHQACTWMDSIKSMPQYSNLTPCHYVNINFGTTYDTTSTNNIVFELRSVLGELSKMNNLDENTITQYVLELFHLVGDIHQPLHCGYATDAGGNSTRVTYLGQNTNLHSVWDYSLVQSGNISLSSCLASNRFTAMQIQAIQQVDVLAWMNESSKLVESCYYFENNNILDSNYIATRIPIVKEQLLKAGLRLASVLEMVFGSNSSLPVIFLSFDVQSAKNQNTLFWEIATNQNVVQFSIEKSNDGVSFNKIGIVESSLSDDKLSYYFVDILATNIAYYRLKTVFMDGSIQYSSVIIGGFEDVRNSAIDILPNPVKSSLTVRFNQSNSKLINIQLIGFDGKIYKTQQVQSNPGKMSVNLNLDGLKKGVYIIMVEGVGMQKVLVD